MSGSHCLARGGPSGSSSPGPITILAPQSPTTKPASARVNRVLTGTATAPAAWAPRNARHQSSPFGVWPHLRQVGEERWDRRRDPPERAASGRRRRGAGLVVRAEPARRLDLAG